MYKSITSLILLLLFAQVAIANYDDHIGGSGTVSSGTLAVCGDNILADTSTYNDLPAEYNITGQPAFVQLQAKFTGWTVTNYSTDNQTVVDYTPTITSANAILLNYGIGDLKIGTTPANFKSEYKELITSLKTSHPSAKIYLANLSPIQPWYNQYDTVSADYNAYQTALKEIATEESITLIDLYLLNAENPKYFIDGLKPVLQGAEFIAERVYEVITGDISFSVPSIFTNNMVLQRGKPIPVFGRATPGTTITVTWDATSTNEIAVTTADSHGYWMTSLTSKTADSTGKTLTIVNGGNNLAFSNILIGDVWFAPGQSNMASVYVHHENSSPSAEDEFTTDGPFPNIRLLHMTEKNGGAGSGGADQYNWNQPAAESMTRFDYWDIANGGWYAADSYSDISSFSAIAWCFAKQVHEDEGVPVGIVEMAIGGTTIESYIPHNGFLSEEEIKASVTTEDETLGGMLNWVKDPLGGPNWAQNNVPLGRANMTPDVVPFPYHPMEHSFLYKSAIEHFVPYAIKGFIWYQGETNADAGNPVSRNKAQYRALVRGWRQAWQNATGIDDKLAFIGVQLPQINASSRAAWPSHRQAMYEFFREANYSADPALRLENVGIAVTMEFGPDPEANEAPSNVHPHRKREISERLARAAQRFAYNNTSYHHSGPCATTATQDNSQLRIAFDPETLGDGLQAYDDPNGTLDYFEVAGDNGIYYDATATISGNEVLVSSPSVAAPVAVRYMYHMAPIGDPATGKLKMLASEAPAIETPNTNSQKILTASPFVLGEESIIIPPAPTPAASEGFIDSWEFDSITPPTGWQMNNSSSPVNEIVATPDGGNALRIYTDSGSKNSFVEAGLDGNNTPWDTDVNISTGVSSNFTVETRLQITSGSSYISPDSFGAYIIATITPTGIEFDGNTYPSDNSSDFVVIRLTYEQATDKISLYRNGQFIADKTDVPNSSRSRIFIGDGSSSITLDMLVDYVRYSTTGHTPFVPQASEFYSVENNFESDDNFTVSTTGSVFDNLNNQWSLGGSASIVDSGAPQGAQALSLQDGDSTEVTIVRAPDYSKFGVTQIKVKASAGADLANGLTVNATRYDSSTLTPQSQSLTATPTEYVFTINDREVEKISFTYSGTAGETIILDEVKIAAYAASITAADVIGGETLQNHSINDTVTISQVKLTIDQGIPYIAEGIQIGVPSSIAADYANNWDNIQIWHSTTNDLANATEASSVDYDLSDVSLYEFFQVTSSDIDLVEGDNYLWVTARYIGPEGDQAPVTCDSVELEQAGSKSSINPLESSQADPAFNFTPDYHEITDSTVTQVSGTTTAGATDEKVIRLQIDTSGDYNPHSLTGLNLVLSQPGFQQVDSVKIYSTTTSDIFATDNLIHTVTDPYGPSDNGTHAISSFDAGPQSLPSGSHYFWIAFDVSATAAPGVPMDASITSLELNNGSLITETPTETDPSGDLTVVFPEVVNTSFESITGTTPGLDANPGWHANDVADNNSGVAFANNPLVDTLDRNNVWTSNGATIAHRINGSISSDGDGALWTTGTQSAEVDIANASGIGVVKFTNQFGSSSGSATWKVEYSFNGGSWIQAGTGSAPSSSSWTEEEVTINAHGLDPRVRISRTGGNKLWLFDEVRITDYQDPAYNFSSATTTQESSTTFPGITNQQLIGIQVEVSGFEGVAPVLNAFDISLSGVDKISDVKLFSTGKSNAFSSDNEISSATAAASLNINGLNQSLLSGTNYFWLAVDINSTASAGTIDAILNSITVDTVSSTPTVSAPAGELTLAATPLGVLMSTGFEVADHFDTNKDGTGSEVASDVAYMTAEESITDAQGNVWRTSGDLKNWASGNNFMGDGACAEFNFATVGSFWEVTPLPTGHTTGEFRFNARRGTSGSTDMDIKAWNIQTQSWDTLGTITAFNSSSITPYSYDIDDTALYSKYRLEVTAASNSRVHFDNVELEALSIIDTAPSTQVSYSFEDSEFSGYPASDTNTAIASEEVYTHNDSSVWTFSAGSWIINNSFDLFRTGEWAWGSQLDDSITIQNPTDFNTGIKSISLWNRAFGSAAYGDIIIETSSNGTAWAEIDRIAVDSTTWAQGSIYIGDNTATHLRITHDGTATNHILGIDDIIIDYYGQIAQSIDTEATVSHIDDRAFQGEARNVQALNFEIVTQGTLTPYKLTELAIQHGGTAIEGTDFDGIEVYFTGSENNYLKAVAENNTTQIYSGSTGSLTLSTEITLNSGSNNFFVIYKLRNDANGGVTLDPELSSYGLTAAENPNGNVTVPSVTNGNPTGDNIVIRTSGGTETIKIFMIAGQSNAAGKGLREYYDLDNQNGTDGVEFWLGGSNTSLNIPSVGNFENVAYTSFLDRVPMGTGNRDGDDGEGPEGDSGVEITLAKTLKAGFPDEKIAIIKYAHSGSSLAENAKVGGNENWFPGHDGDPDTYDATLGHRYRVFRDSAVLPALRAITERGDSADVAGFYWIQGHANRSESESAYKTKLVNLYDRVSREFSAPNISIYNVRLNSALSTGGVYQAFTKIGRELLSSDANADQTNVGAYTTADIGSVNFDLNNVFTIDTNPYGADTLNNENNPNPGMFDGDVHYNSQALEEMGELPAQHFVDQNISLHTVTFNPGINGSIASGEAVQSIIDGQDATLPTISPNTGWIFTEWDNDGTNITADITINAIYQVITYTVTFNAGTNGSIAPEDENQTVNHGGNANLPEVEPNEGWQFINWDNNGENITDNITINAVYEVITYTVTFNAGTNGSIAPEDENQTVNHGGNATAPTVTENEGYTFTGWDNTFTNVTADITVTAQYDIITNTVTFVIGENGTATGQLIQTVNYGANATAPIVTANEGYTFIGWDNTFTNVTASTTVTAQYSGLTNTVTFVIGENGTATGNLVQTVNYGENAIAPIVTANEGYTFIGWDNTFTNVTADATITAEYEIMTYTVTFVIGENGTASGELSQIVEHGSPATEPVVTANEGYTFTGWDSLDFLEVTENLTISALFEADMQLHPRYRLYNANDGNHHWTTSLDEYNFLVSVGWAGEGFDHRVILTEATIEEILSLPYYRLYNPNNGEHHWTTSFAEYEAVGNAGWHQESFNSHVFATQAEGTVPLYRIYNPNSGLHHYTTNIGEYNLLVTAGWVDEGVSAFVFSKE